VLLSLALLQADADIVVSSSINPFRAAHHAHHLIRPVRSNHCPWDD